jgi:hypothetical protein
VGGEKRPHIATRIAELVVGNGARPLGKAVWSYIAAVDHGGWYGVTPAIVEGPPAERDLLGLSLASVGTDSKSVNPQSFGLLRALRLAGESRRILMGWTKDDVWQEASAQSIAHEAFLLDAMRA